MDISNWVNHDAAAIAELFRVTFTASEGADEGALIEDFVKSLLSTTPQSDIRVFLGAQDGALCAAAVFTRLKYPEDPRTVFILSPMAVAPDFQRRGWGQSLLSHALATLREEGVDIAVTYGDPGYYKRVGFSPISEKIVPAPMPLSYPEGWIAQSLGEDPLSAIKGPCICAPALKRQDIW